MDKILVAYATWAGATHSVADEIAKVFKDKKVDVVVAPAKNVDSLSDYHAVILGTSIHAGKTLGDFNKFLKRFHEEMANIPVAVFVVCANMNEDCENNRNETAGWLNKALEKYADINPISTGLFGGALITDSEDFKKLNVMIRKLILSMEQNYLKEFGKTDFRDWSKIRAWTEEVYKKL